MDYTHILLVFAATTLFWTTVKGVLELFRSIKYREKYEEEFAEYWDKLKQQCPKIQKEPIRLGYLAGYHQAFFRENILDRK